MNRTLRSALWSALVIGVSAFLLLRHLGDDSFLADEANYARIVLATRTANAWWPIGPDGDPALNKPPLGFLAIRASVALFGDTEGAARLPAALSGILIAAALFAAAARRHGELAGAFAALVWVTIPLALNRHELRGATFDGLLALFVTLALLAHQESLRPGRERWFRVVVGLVAVATLIKTLAAAALVSIAVLATELVLAWRRPARRGALVRRGLLRVAAVFAAGLVMLLLWWLALAALGVQGAFERIVTWDLLQRHSSGVDPGHLHASTFYALRVARDFGPLLLLLAPLAARALRAGRKDGSVEDDARDLALLIAPAAMLGLLSLSPSKLPWYALPTYPILCLALAAGGSALLRDRSRGFRALVATALVAVLAFRFEWALRRTHANPMATVLDRLHDALAREPETDFAVAPGLAIFQGSRPLATYRWDYEVSNAYYLDALAARPAEAGPDSTGGHCRVLLVERDGAPPPPDDAPWHRLDLPEAEGPFALLESCGGRILARLDPG